MHSLGYLEPRFLDPAERVVIPNIWLMLYFFHNTSIVADIETEIINSNWLSRKQERNTLFTLFYIYVCVRSRVCLHVCLRARARACVT